MEEKRETSVILFFIDGLGIGKREASNPFFQLPGAEPLGHFVDEPHHPTLGERLAVTDPRLGVEGRPQSASGQTTILTGKNAPGILGYHKQGFPNQALRELISAESIFKKLRDLKIAPNTFANAYTPGFFQSPPRWKSATTCAVEAAGMPFLRLPDLVGGHALFHDFTNRLLIGSEGCVPLLRPEDAAEILAKIGRRNRFTLYEHFLTDKIGHGRDMKTARRHLPALAEFVRETIKRLDPELTTFILTSDHGNIEDLSVRTHTLNDVPTLVWGRKSEATVGSIRDLSDISPAVIRLLSE